MTDDKLFQLKTNTREKLLLTCDDGELMQVRVLHIVDERRDVVCELLHTTGPRQYRQKNGVYISVTWEEIVDLREI